MPTNSGYGPPQVDFSGFDPIGSYEQGAQIARQNAARAQMAKCAPDDFGCMVRVLGGLDPEQGAKLAALVEQNKSLNEIKAFSAMTPGQRILYAQGQSGAETPAGPVTPQTAAPVPAVSGDQGMAAPQYQEPVPPPEAGAPAPADAAVAQAAQPAEGAWTDLGGGIRGRIQPGQNLPQAQPSATPPATAPSGLPPGFSPTISSVGAEPPTGYEHVPAAVTKEFAPVGTVETAQERAKNVEKLRMTFPTDQALSTNVMNNFKRISDVAKTFIDKNGNATDDLMRLTGDVRIGKLDTNISKAYLPNFYTKTRAAAARFENMGIQIGLAALQAMRDASKSGSSGMGQLAIQESYWLQRSITSLNEAQGPKQAAEAVKQIIYWSDQVQNVVAQKFHQTYGGLR